ncbi:Gfo/Idh/MocA family protein [Treponema sp.]|uniref:Gfo/Idh/MocA family protein n=1 Tax=Treponema sp. TaxID=166 RepID=UPI003F11748C
MRTYTAVLVGLGRIGYTLGLDEKREQPASHTMALLGNSRIHLVAGCDTDSSARARWHEANSGTEVYSDSSSLYAACRPDIITVAVNEASHLNEALCAIHARPRLVILEKPVALNLAEAEKIRVEAEKYQVPFLVNHERRFAEDFKLAKSYMEKIGELQSIHAQLYSSLCVYNPAEENTGAYSLIHDGTHLVDAVLFFLENSRQKTEKSGLLRLASALNFSSPVLASPVVTGIFSDSEKNIRQFSAHYTTPQCPDVCVCISGRSRFFGFEISITGTEGRICIGNGYLKLYRRGESHLYTGFYSLFNDRSEKIPEKTRYFSNMVQNAVDFLDGKNSLRSTLQTGIEALSVLEEIKEILKKSC